MCYSVFVVTSDVWFLYLVVGFFFFFQAEDGIRDAQESRGLGDVYKRQPLGEAIIRAVDMLVFQLMFGSRAQGAASETD